MRLIILELHQIVSVAVTCSRRYAISVVSLPDGLRLLQASRNVSTRLGLAVALATGTGRCVANILHARAGVAGATQVTRRLLCVVSAGVVALAAVGLGSAEAVVVAAGARFVAAAHSALFNFETAHSIGQTARRS